MFHKLEAVEKKFEELTTRLSDPTITQNPKEYQAVAKEQASLSELIACFRAYKNAKKQIEDNKLMLQENDDDLKSMAKEELAHWEPELQKLESELKIHLLPKDPLDEKNIFLEIRAGAGGDEAGLFAAELFRLYCRYAEGKKWRVEIMDMNDTGVGGLKEVIAEISGEKVYSDLKYESGVHRVQRVPKTEAQGRVHTSTVTVAVMPEAEDVEVDIQEKDLRIDVMRASGPGGQSVNTTDSAVRVTHIPTGLVVVCKDEKSQHKNKAKALKVLKSRMLEAEREKQDKEISDNRRSQIGSGDRSEKIRTYNFPQNRVTDHRIGLTLHKLDTVMEGNIDELIQALRAYYQALALKGESE
ncbi:MAG: peptide chain release factor 1 [Deltaproteobacteria bacterium]|nr:peptide chain release factor 1 [Deltaproteobacteria bacterium]